MFSRRQSRAPSFFGFVPFRDTNGSFWHEVQLHQLDSCQNKLARRLLAETRRAWNAESETRQSTTKELHRKPGTVPIAMVLRIRRLGWVKKMAEQIQNDDLAHQQVSAATFGQTRLDKHPCMTDDGKLTFYATP